MSTNVIDLIKYRRDKDEAIMKRQQEEYVSLMKYFVYTQDNKYNVIHIKINKDNKVTYSDNHGNPLESHLQDYTRTVNSDITSEDLLISNMLTFPANTYVLHGTKYLDKESLKILKTIFENKLITFEE